MERKMNEELKNRLAALGANETDLAAIDNNAFDEESLGLIDAAKLNSIGVRLGIAVKIENAFKPVVAPTAAPVADPIGQEIPEGTKPSEAQVNAFATHFGMDSNWTNLFMMGQVMKGTMGLDEEFDFSSMIPVASILPSYSPKKRDMPYLLMAQLERQLVDRGRGEGIIIINADGSINRELTAQHIYNLDQLIEPYPEDGVYYDVDGNPYQIIQVGVDAQSYSDADPLNASVALGQNQRGRGGIRYNGTSQDVRVLIYLADQMGEINETSISWLRHNISPTTSLKELAIEFPLAMGKYNELSRGSNLPTLRVMNTRKPRRRDPMPRRRRMPDRGSEGLPGTGSGFLDDER